MAPTMGGVDSAELTCLAALREARAVFYHAIVNHAQAHRSSAGEATKAPLAAEDIDLLRSDYAYHLAEFYYLVDELRLAHRGKIRAYLQRHNTDMKALMADRARLSLMGLSPQRMKDVSFSDTQVEKVVENIVDGKLRLDQSDLGRLLAQLMSPEICRKTVVALAKGGLLHRINIGQVLIISPGHLEKYFRDHLSIIVSSISEIEGSRMSA